MEEKSEFELTSPSSLRHTDPAPLQTTVKRLLPRKSVEKSVEYSRGNRTLRP
jgi:hypothetical protein